VSIFELQTRVQENTVNLKKPCSSGAEFMLAATEELGEVAQEVALLERIGSKATWQKEPSVERLGEEISHAPNCLIALANHYQIDLEKLYNPES
jgi:NTP pyrophosphatase (non-canonical NTP hydrolase)